jgi:hypothetical protein
MDEAGLRSVREIAMRFRRALEKWAPASGSAALRQFPVGSCADAVLLLGAYFIDSGVGAFDAVGGEFGTDPQSRRSHAWLERDGVIVDITADQFPDVSEPVIVTRDPTWHRRFHPTNRGVADFRRYGGETSSQLGAVYAQILNDVGGGWR